MTLDRAIEVFVRAVAASRSRTYPCLAERLDGLWILHDAPGRKDPRKTEIVAHGLSPEGTVSRARRQVPGWHFLCVIHPWSTSGGEDFAQARNAYKELGYRAVSTEWMYFHPLQDIPQHASEPPVRPVESQEQADRIPQLSAHKVKLLPGTRRFGIWDERRDYGWVTSIPVGDDTWVQGLHVRPDCRRRGYGSALMSTLLQSDAKMGSRASVLLASTAGAKLYPRLGYEQIAILQMFCPLHR